MRSCTDCNAGHTALTTSSTASRWVCEALKWVRSSTTKERQDNAPIDTHLDTALRPQRSLAPTPHRRRWRRHAGLYSGLYAKLWRALTPCPVGTGRRFDARLHALHFLHGGLSRPARIPESRFERNGLRPSLGSGRITLDAAVGQYCRPDCEQRHYRLGAARHHAT